MCFDVPKKAITEIHILGTVHSRKWILYAASVLCWDGKGNIGNSNF